MPSDPPPDFFGALETLARHGVDFIVVGNVSAVLLGAPIATFDLDVVYSLAPDNVTRLGAALQELKAYYRSHRDQRLPPKVALLASGGHHLLMTTCGPLDVLGTVGNRGQGYEDLYPHTIEVQPLLFMKVRIIDLPTLIVLKEELGRDKDKAVLPILRRALEERNRK